MPCIGSGITPLTIYRAPHKKTRSSGYLHGLGECRHCKRVVCTKVKDNRQLCWSHSDKPQKHDRQWKQRLENSLVMTVPTGAVTSAYCGPVVQQINVVEATGTTFGGFQRYQTGQSFLVEMQTGTSITTTGSYIFNINGQYLQAPTNRITITTDNLVWNSWQNTYSVGIQSRVYLDQTWNDWNQIQVYQPNQVANQVNRVGYARPVETAEQMQERRQQAALALFQRVEAERLATQSASERALGTLLGLLTPEQREEYAAKEFFHVVGSEGNLYRIIKGSSGNIRRVVSREETGRGEAAFCVHSVSRVTEDQELGLVGGHLPHEDHMIQQMLHLQYDEKEILAKANLHWGTREPSDAELERFFAAEEANQRDRERLHLGV